MHFFFLHIGNHNTDTAKLKTASPPAIIQIRYSAIPDAVVNAAVKQISEKSPYGIGMKNVEETVKKYAGTLNTEVKDGKYITDVILYEIGIRHAEKKES
ncbi:MAG TPA: ATP-binding protein [Candidatus Mediterraneibacter gallistercoris]|uniref:ATP-binding protein n=1 Tax=Candidatus Mediterraneibacter gallistercoris TaxID=2838671 RepID=A0A9D2P6V2_9FIRM|nr:ATP-binding protein [Candidatus Mediterraneibacter gallistercoris]